MTQAAKTMPRDWILVALLKAGDAGLNAVQLQKVMFLLGERRAKAVGRSFYSFDAYNYGPFSRNVYDDADAAIAAGLVELDASWGRSRRTYHLTDAGRREAEKLAKALPREGVEYLGQAVPWAQKLSFNELVRAVYEAFPEMRKNSVFQD